MNSTAKMQTLPDGQTAWLRSWEPEQRPRGVVQIIHGMAEHGARYARLAHALNAKGFAVYAQDLPGHGHSAGSVAALGHFGTRGEWRLPLAAINGVRALIEQEQPGIPLFLLGHSMGSFLAQHYLVEHGEGLAGAILSASSATMGPLRGLGERLMRLEARLFGAGHRSALAEALTFKDFNRRFRPTRTGSDWLSRDPAEVDAYVADPYCGFRCSAGLWAELLRAGAVLTEPARLVRVPKNLPLLLIAGSADPVCQGGRGSHLLAKAYRDAGLEFVEIEVYPEARHELLNETCREQVTQDLLEWLLGRVALSQVGIDPGAPA
ncbi:MAG: alpha/beta hydrolase [Stagnimonas sp.]|nr:alpha/beta hydrolase [Stagnimonas sp.]